jgi:hypothetical protein
MYQNIVHIEMDKTFIHFYNELFLCTTENGIGEVW